MHGVPALPLLQTHSLSPIVVPPITAYSAAVSSAYIEAEDTSSDEEQHFFSEPSVEFVRRTWWDHLLALYCPTGITPNGVARDTAARAIYNDVKFLFHTTSYHFSFFHVRRFFSTLTDQNRRNRLQPSLVLSALAVARLLQSSQFGEGRLGMQKALLLRDEAQAKLEASLNARAIDEELAQAAWVSPTIFAVVVPGAIALATFRSRKRAFGNPTGRAVRISARDMHGCNSPST